ncbi:DUF4238 domain-containing protein [Dendrosporobacter sp. 1207_IL3150]|uniref:DUF4238 domain-containing protein n=1 Tax=Dendrosporobacter sp. 1207_IL3150 TaxID=3084054 RepID=UPI002FD909DC
MSQPRRHHYIPQMYLAGFTSDGTKDGQLYTIDLKQSKRWKCRPNGIANIRDFYRIDISDQDPFVIEHGFAEIEGAIATVLKDIFKTRKLPSGDNLITLLHLVALSSSKVPAMREQLGKPIVEVTKRFLDLTLANPERYYSILKDVKNVGIGVSKYPSYEKVREAYDNDGFAISPSQNWNMQSCLMMADILLPLLKDRYWGLVIPKNPSDIFICSDNPVSLMWTKESMLKYPPGFGFKRTMVFMPLCSNIGLIGLFTPTSPIMEFNSLGIASLNTETLSHAHEQVYSRDMSFKILGKNDSLQDFPPEDILLKK